MGYVVSQLQAVLSLEDKGFTSGMKNAQQETKKTKQEVESASSSFEKIGSSLSRIGSSLSIGVTAPLFALGRQAIKTATDFDSLKKGMIAVEGSSAAAERSIKRLEQSAKLPGLGLKEVQRGYINLRAAGQQADLATRSLEAFGNALATVGKGKSDLDGVILALTQIESKGKVSAEEINQLAERVPQIRQIMLSAFGTADTEVIQKAKISSRQFVEAIVGELEKLPKAAGGLQNDFDNAMDTISLSLDRLGSSLAPKAAAGLNFLADKVEKLSMAWDKLPKEQQDLYTTLGLGALAAGPATMLLGNLAQLAVNLNQLGISLGTVGRFGAVALPVLAAVMAFKPHWVAAGETADAEKSAKEGNAYVASSSLGQAITAKDEARTLQQYMGYLKKGQGAYEFFRANRGPGFDDIASLLDRELGPDRQSDSQFKVSQAIARLTEKANAAQKASTGLQAQAYKDSISGFFGQFKPSNLLKNSPKLNAAEIAEQRRQEEEARKEAERERKRLAEEARRHAENFARNTQEGRDELSLLTAPDDFTRQRRQASQKRRDDLKKMDKKLAEQIYQAELERIAKLEKEARQRALDDAMREFGKLLDPVGTVATILDKATEKAIETRKKKDEQIAKTREGIEAIGDRIAAKGLPFNYMLDPLRLDGQQLSPIEDLRVRAKETVSPTGGLGRDDHDLPESMRPYDLTLKQARERARRVDWHRRAYMAGEDTAGSIARSSGGFAYDMLSGRSAKDSGRRMKDSLVEALNQGAAKEIERVVARSITDPIAKAIEQGFDPVTGKLKGAISEALGSVTSTAAAVVSSAYALYGVMGRKKKFGIGSLLGGIAGFATGGPAGAMAGYNIGNALDNGDLVGAATGVLVTNFSQDAAHQPFKRPGAGASNNGQLGSGTYAMDHRSVVIHNTGWTVNSQADETRLVTNMARRVRVASVVGR